jgi:hypothetical protein
MKNLSEKFYDIEESVEKSYRRTHGLGEYFDPCDNDSDFDTYIDDFLESLDYDIYVDIELAP